MDEAGHHDENPRHAVQMENTYQLGEPCLVGFFLVIKVLISQEVMLVADVHPSQTLLLDLI